MFSTAVGPARRLRRQTDTVHWKPPKRAAEPGGLHLLRLLDAALACLDTIDGDVKAAYNKASCAALLAGGSTPLTLLKLGFGSRILTAAGATVDLTDLISSGATLRKLG